MSILSQFDLNFIKHFELVFINFQKLKLTFKNNISNKI